MQSLNAILEMVNMEMLNSVEKIESFLEALKSAFRKKVYDIAFKGAK